MQAHIFILEKAASCILGEYFCLKRLDGQQTSNQICLWLFYMICLAKNYMYHQLTKNPSNLALKIKYFHTFVHRDLCLKEVNMS